MGWNLEGGNLTCETYTREAGAEEHHAETAE